MLALARVKMNSRTVIRAIALIMNGLGFSLTGNSQVQVKIMDTVKIHESHTYGFFPSLQMLSTGELLCDVSLDADKDEVETNFWAYVISKDKGRTWGMRNTAGLAFREAAYTRNPSLADGTMLMISGVGLPTENDYKNLQFVSIEFSDGANTARFSRDVHVHVPIAAASEPIEDDVVHCASLNGARVHEAASIAFCGTLLRDRSGRWLDTMYGKMVGDKYYRTFLVRSDDKGRNWSYMTTIAGDSEAEAALKSEHEEQTEGFCEPRMIRLPDGRLLVVMRRGSNNVIFRSWSNDDGQSWSKPSSIGFKGVKPNLWLMSSGILALCTGRPEPVKIRFSVDGGETWTNTTQIMGAIKEGDLYDPKNRLRSTCYTGMAEVEPNKLLIVYDYLPNVGGWGTNSEDGSRAMNTIYGTFVSVSP